MKSFSLIHHTFIVPNAFLAILALTLFSIDLAHGQGCCTVGASSLGGVESGVLKPGNLRVGVNYQFNSITRTYQERARIDDPLQRTASVGYFNVHAEYGLQPGLSLYLLLYFSDKSREITVTNAISGFTETATFGTSGIGDLTLLAKYQLVKPTITSPFEAAIGAGASLPTGSFSKEQTNAQLSIDLQPGTGATTLIGWVFAKRSFLDVSLSIFANASYRYSGTNFDSYRIGDEILTNIGGEYSFSDNFSGSIVLRSRFARQDFSNRRILNATGGTFHDFMPGISYYDGPSHFRAFAQIPVYRNVRGIQLTLSHLLGVEYSYTLDFSNPSLIETD